MADCAIDTLPRPEKGAAFTVGSDPFWVDYNLAAPEKYRQILSTANHRLSPWYVAALVPDSGDPREGINLLAIAALPEWIAEAERWKRAAEMLAAQLLSGNMGAVGEAYMDAGEA